MLSLIAFILMVFVVVVLYGKITSRTTQRVQEENRYDMSRAHHDFMYKDGADRAAGAEFMARSNDPEVIPTLLRGRRDPLGSDPEDECVNRAIASICEANQKDPVQVRREYDLQIIGITPPPDLIPWFNSPDSVLRDAAGQKVAIALRVDPSGDLASQVLATAFSGTVGINARLRAADSLVTARLEDRLIQQAIAILETTSRNRLDHEDAIEVLGRYDAGAEAIPCLIRQAKEQQWGMSPRAIKALTRIVRVKSEKLSVEELESIGSLLAEPVLVQVAAPDNPENVTVETVNTTELQTLVADALAGRSQSHRQS